MPKSICLNKEFQVAKSTNSWGIWNNNIEKLLQEHGEQVILEVDNADFDNYSFSGKNNVSEILFKNVHFKKASFWATKFRLKISFSNAVFKSDVRFNNSEFFKGCYFSNASFEEEALFGLVKFNEKCSFWESCFSGQTSFQSALFQDNASFNHSFFKLDTLFDGSVFHNKATFDGSSFFASVGFEKVTFMGDTLFRGMRTNGKLLGAFHSTAFFSFAIFFSRVEFTNWQFNEVFFTRVQFDKEAVFANNDLTLSTFHYVDLNNNIYFYNVKWRKDKGRYLFLEEISDSVFNENEDEKFGLKQALKHYNELVSYYDNKRDVTISEGFFVSEMAVRSALSSWLQKPIYKLYCFSSRYGTSWLNALVVLLCLVSIVCPSIMFVGDNYNINNFTLSLYFTSFSENLITTMKALLLHKNIYYNINNIQFYSRAFCQLLLLGQSALFFLAIRRSFRRASPSN